ncbi:hypothetical protein M8J76_013379 [Diaphorina citri]|nr:hypothetical protein M8J75_004748 [Diaphorina citri]KAI5748895.1 hypothetical protein M8J76_002977 [Diaphorina citri]KAI5750168.1 hypothetical protein M8J76_013379 [Diaphorina citri]
MKMLKSGLITLCSVLVTVRANEFSILHTPEAIEFQPSSTIDLRTVKDVFTAALGISVKQDHRWSGMDIKNPFETAEAVVSFIIPGLSSLNFLHAHDYDLLINDNTDNVYDSLLNLISHKYAANNQTTVKVTFKSSEPEMESSIDVLTGVVTEATPFSEIKKFDLEKDIDKAFIGNIHLLKAVAKKALVGHSDGIPDVYWFSLPVVSDFIDQSSSSINEDKLVEAENLLIKTISAITEDYKKFYNGKVLVATLLGTEMSSHSMRYRRAVEVAQNAALNLGEEYDEDYPVIFNILLWSAIAFIFTLIAISLAIGNMDPGRDSIIYRMTSTRIKKDS